MAIDRVIEEIRRICIEFSAEKVILYGPSAKGTSPERSDIDIAVAGAADFCGLSEAIENIETLYMIDVLNLDTCSNQSLVEDIEKYGQEIWISKQVH